MPSPRKPTTWLRCLSARIIRFFCAGDTRANTCASLGHVRQGRVVHASDLVAQDHLLAVDSDLRADVLGHQFIVAGQDLDLHAVAPQGGDRLGRTLKRRIGESQESDQDQIALVRERSVLRRDRPAGRRPPERGIPSRSAPGKSRRNAFFRRRPADAVTLESRIRCNLTAPPSGAPLVIRSVLPSLSTTIDSRRRSKSKGISSVL